MHDSIHQSCCFALRTICYQQAVSCFSKTKPSGSLRSPRDKHLLPQRNCQTALQSAMWDRNDHLGRKKISATLNKLPPGQKFHCQKGLSQCQSAQDDPLWCSFSDPDCQVMHFLSVLLLIHIALLELLCRRMSTLKRRWGLLEPSFYMSNNKVLHGLKQSNSHICH